MLDLVIQKFDENFDVKNEVFVEYLRNGGKKTDKRGYIHI